MTEFIGLFSGGHYWRVALMAFLVTANTRLSEVTIYWLMINKRTIAMSATDPTPGVAVVGLHSGTSQCPESWVGIRELDVLAHKRHFGEFGTRVGDHHL